MGPEIKPNTLPSVGLPTDILRPIAHTHPSGNFQLSTKDIDNLEKKGMKSHVIINPYTNRGIRLYLCRLKNLRREPVSHLKTGVLQVSIIRI
jgi:proteasome lid subunit RPN8/RPN11